MPARLQSLSRHPQEPQEPGRPASSTRMSSNGSAAPFTAASPDSPRASPPSACSRSPVAAAAMC